MTPAREYPEILESWWISEACRVTAASDPEAALPALETDVQALSDLFTVARPDRYRDYGTPRSLAAYGIFFFPQSYVRARLPLSEALQFRGWKPADSALRVLDLGAGLGAAGLGAAHWLLGAGHARSIELHAVDHSPEALRRLSSLSADLAPHHPGLRVHTHRADIREPGRLPPALPKTFDLVIAAFALNEAVPGAQPEARLAWLKTAASLLSPGGLLLVLEPALRETAEPLSDLADAAVAQRLLHRWGPDLHQGPSPLRAEGKYWPHEVRAWTVPDSLARVNRRLWRSVGDLKFAYALFSNTPPPPLPPGPKFFRLASPWSLMKGGFVGTGIATDGNKYAYEMPIRGLEKARVRELEKIERGNILEVSAADPMKLPGHFRISGPDAILRHYSPR